MVTVTVLLKSTLPRMPARPQVADGKGYRESNARFHLGSTDFPGLDVVVAVPGEETRG